MTNLTKLKKFRDAFSVVVRDPATQEALKFDNLSESEATALIRDAKKDSLQVLGVLAPVRYFN